MDLAEAEGIARYLAKAGLPEGDSIAERQNQLPVILLAEIDRLRAQIAAESPSTCVYSAKEFTLKQGQS